MCYAVRLRAACQTSKTIFRKKKDEEIKKSEPNNISEVINDHVRNGNGFLFFVTFERRTQTWQEIPKKRKEKFPFYLR